MESLSNSYELSVDEQMALIQKAAKFSGQIPIQRSSKADLLRVHSENLSLLSQSSKTRQTRDMILPAAYSPSKTSLNELQKVSLEALTLETHHRGSFITAKTITNPYRSMRIISIIEDECGNVEKLALYYHDDLVPDSIIPENSTVAIKEPYYAYNGDGDYVIRVDHPSDIAVLRGDDPTVSLIMQVVREKREMGASEWKDAGDKAYMGKSYLSAIECYTQAIETASKDNQAFIRDVYRKRCYANLTAKHYDSAKEDALASCSGELLDGRAYYCAGRAAYELRIYGESQNYFGKAVGLSPGDLKYKQDYNRAVARVREEQEGDYDFKAMLASLSDNNIHLDHADFTSNAAVGPSENKGRGLFATREIEAGSLVLCEKAFCLPNLYGKSHLNDLVLYNVNTTAKTQRASQPALLIQLVEKLYSNPLLNSKFFDLDSGTYVRSGLEGQLVDGVPVVDVFLVEAIRLRNCFSSPRKTRDLLETNSTVTSGEFSTGLWTHASYINHSCVPNCVRSFIGDMQILRATCNIPAGSEITHSYLAPEPLYTTRKELFQENWKFDCDCRLCSAEVQSTEPMDQRRRDVIQKLKTEVIKHRKSSFIPEATIRKVERLTEKLEELHEPHIYADLPRLLLVSSTIWLMEAYRLSHNPTKTIKYAFEVLRNFGFISPITDGKLKLDNAVGITNSESLRALRIASEAYETIGESDMARQCDEAARLGYTMLVGTSEGIDGFWEKIE